MCLARSRKSAVSAARELAPFRDFAIDAGGDLYLGGWNEPGAPWRVGIHHPGPGEGLIASLQVSESQEPWYVDA
jgi:thiamine biosynthesis lipoprotein ApbE